MSHRKHADDAPDADWQVAYELSNFGSEAPKINWHEQPAQLEPASPAHDAMVPHSAHRFSKRLMRMLRPASIIVVAILLINFEQILKIGGAGLILVGLVALMLLPFALFFGFLGAAARVVGEGLERGKRAVRKE